MPSDQASRNYSILVEAAGIGIDPHRTHLERGDTDLRTDFPGERDTVFVD